MTILHIDSSLAGDASVTRRMTAAIVAGLKAGGDEAVIHHDLAKVPVAVFDPYAGAPDFTLIDEVLAADVIVIGAPMYNLGVPAGLKAWIDAITIPDKTFRATEAGLEGLCGARRVIVAYAAGGFLNGPNLDFVEPYLRAFFRLIGITTVDVVRAEGLGISDELHAKAVAAADAEIAALTTRIRAERAA